MEDRSSTQKQQEEPPFPISQRNPTSQFFWRLRVVVAAVAFSFVEDGCARAHGGTLVAFYTEELVRGPVTLCSGDDVIAPTVSAPFAFASALDEAVLFLDLRDQNPQLCALDNYQRELFRLTGTYASESTICNWFLRGNEYTGGMRVSNLVPKDKFTDENVERFLDYRGKIKKIHPCRIKFGDEKLLKGSELYSRKVRHCPETGVMEDVTVD